jgi:hypothetical protein
MTRLIERQQLICRISSMLLNAHLYVFCDRFVRTISQNGKGNCS